MKTRLFFAVLVGGFTVFSGCATPGNPSKRCWLFFETTSSAAAPREDAPKQAAAATPAVVAIQVAPPQVVLGPAQHQAFSAVVTGTSNTAVNWSINPALGSVAANGLYTAPERIALPESVAVTATSQAEGSRSASGLVQLRPPAAAPAQVSIELKVFFDTGKDIVKPEYSGEMKNVADFMKTYPSAKAEIEGHTDNVGSQAMNMGLSQRRADSVRQYLIRTFGVDASRLTAKGYGPTKPVAGNTTAEGRAKNRRVVATFSGSQN